MASSPQREAYRACSAPHAPGTGAGPGGSTSSQGKLLCREQASLCASRQLPVSHRSRIFAIQVTIDPTDSVARLLFDNANWTLCCAGGLLIDNVKLHDEQPPAATGTAGHRRPGQKSCWDRGPRAARPGERRCLVPGDFVRAAVLPVDRRHCCPHQRSDRQCGGHRRVVETGAR
jgi:hypothetical protein